MDTVSLAIAEANLSELVERAAAGETVCITKHGKPIAQITAFVHPDAPVEAIAARRKPGEPINLDWLREITKDMTPQEESGGDFIRRMRDEDRY